MSWMDSWSRPSSNSTIPAPLYLANPPPKYCHTCARIISSKKSSQNKDQAGKSEPKYCSAKCRTKKPTPFDREIEAAIAALLNGEPGSKIENTCANDRKVKGDQRLIITCDEVEQIVFGSRFDPDRTAGRRKNRKPRGVIVGENEWRSVDMEDSESNDPTTRSMQHEHGGTESESDAPSERSVNRVNGVRVRPPQHEAEMNFSAMGGERGKAEKIEESAEDLERRKEGDRRAEEREQTRRAMRRIVIFGVEDRTESRQTPSRSKGKGKKGKHDVHEINHEEVHVRRRAEAIMGGVVCEPSYAKGNWSIRWRD